MGRVPKAKDGFEFSSSGGGVTERLSQLGQRVKNGTAVIQAEIICMPGVELRKLMYYLV